MHDESDDCETQCKTYINVYTRTTNPDTNFGNSPGTSGLMHLSSALVLRPLHSTLLTQS